MTNLRRIVLEHRRVVYILAAALVINAALYASGGVSAGAAGAERRAGSRRLDPAT